ncbi:hypothetical protein [Streptomyces sp. NPDC086023]|uniref:hypothetical protein n=1 Tax=Streptomyces sp. NPDC086023 TaxID=3365746 RepID=UPI0037D26C0A
MPAPPLPHPRTPVCWTDHLTPDPAHRTTWSACTRRPELVACGTAWDAVVAPLARGLAGLDHLRLPLAGGFPVLADYVRLELIVQVPAGTGHRCAAPGSRVLHKGTWLLVPVGTHSAASATWLSRPDPATPRYVDADRLHHALLAVGAVPQD